MITVINNFNESTEMYEAKSLAEASTLFMLEANQLVNDFSMDLLLTEHKYLYEHGEQIDWVTESDEGGLKIMDKVNNLVQNAKTLFLKILNNIISFVQEKTAQVIAFFKKHGLDKATITKAFKENGDYKINASVFILDYEKHLNILENEADILFVNKDNAKDAHKNGGLYTKPGQFFEEMEKYFETEPTTAKENGLANTIIEIIYNNDKILKSAKKEYKVACKSLDDEKKRIAGKKTMAAEDINNDLTALRAGIMNNTYIMRDLTKIYAKLLNEAISIAKDVVGEQKSKSKDKKDENKNDGNRLGNGGSSSSDSGSASSKGHKTNSDGTVELNDDDVNIKEAALAYMRECLEGTTEVDEELLQECTEFILEAAKKKGKKAVEDELVDPAIAKTAKKKFKKG